jgi:uncharacterized protein (DUF427 family)
MANEGRASAPRLVNNEATDALPGMRIGKPPRTAESQRSGCACRAGSSARRPGGAQAHVPSSGADDMNNAPASGNPSDADSADAGHGGGDASGRAPAHGDGTKSDHTITITVNRHRVRVIHQGVTFADTHGALTLSETGCPDVFYFPRADVNMARLERSTHTSHCPFKGEASYFHLRTEDETIRDAVWSYEHPLERVKQIAGYLAFYESSVDRIDQTS